MNWIQLSTPQSNRFHCVNCWTTIMNTKPVCAPLSVTTVSILLLASQFILATHSSAGEPLRGHALLIGIEDYDYADKLQGVKNDVDSLRDALHKRGGYTVETVYNSAATDGVSIVGQRSERELLQERIASWLEQRSKADSVILYFSGHGFRDGENLLYLAAKNCDPEDPKPGGVPISWLREQLVQCPARAKLLVLDACHAGNARWAAAKSVVTAEAFKDFFGQTEGLVTLASCAGDQQSYLWPAKSQSIFTYWLAQGLCGNADREPLGEITLNELDDYVARKVRRTAENLNSREQTPTRLQGPNVSQDVILQLQPVDLKTLLDDMAEQMDVEIRLGKLERVGIVPEFASDVMGQTLGREYGALATLCPVELANRLAVKSNGDYRVLNTNAVRDLLQAQGITCKDLGSERCKGISIEGRDLSSLIAGQVQSLQGNTIALQCKMLNLATGDVQGIAGGTARLCASEVAMQGASGRPEPVPSPGVTVPPGAPGLSSNGGETARIDGSAAHPLSDPRFPYRVRIMVKGADGVFSERRGTFRGNECYVRLNRDEVFHIQYRSENRVFAKVLVDGLNTLPEKSQTKGLNVEEAVRNEYRQAQPVNLVEARAWGPLTPNKEYVVTGFYRKVGRDGEVDEFKMVDASESLAAEAAYTDQIGLITVAFYEPQTKPSSPADGGRGMEGVGRGNRYRTQTDIYRGPDEPGRLLAVVSIRYGE